MRKYLSHLVVLMGVLLNIGLALYTRGGIILLDFVGTDNAMIPWTKNAWFLLPQVPVSLFGYEIGTKLVFFLILALAGYLGIIFGGAISEKYLPKYRTTLEILGGVFFLMNPFSYERMMTQPIIYLSTLLIGYLLYMLLYGVKLKYVWSGIFAGFAISLMPHASYMVLMIFVFYFAFFHDWKKAFNMFVMILGIILLINMNWILPSVVDSNTTKVTIQNFSSSNLEAFHTNALSPMNVWGTNLLLYGFWGERYDNHSFSVDLLSKFWYIGGFIFLIIVGYGYFSLWKLHEKKLVIMLGILALSSLIFGIGVASKLSEPLTRFMIDFIPFWQGYREPQKWIGILMLVEGLGFIYGIASILKKWGKDMVVYFSTLTSIFFIFLVWTPGPMFGYHYQLKTTVFPEEFNEIRTKLLATNTGTQEEKILALPWHSYIGCKWMARPTVSNPIRGLLSPLSVVSSDNIEIPNILYSNSQNNQSKTIENFLVEKDFSTLKEYGFTHVLLMKQCIHDDTYEWLSSQSQCTKTYSSAVADLYSCN